MQLTPAQRTILERLPDGSLFLHGPYGTGKSTVGTAWLRRLLDENVPPESILVLTPQRTLQTPYQEAAWDHPYAGGEVTFATIGGLARRVTELFWPLAAAAAGFGYPDRPPIFLTLETAQYYMAHIVRPLIEEQFFFNSVSIPRQRLYSQILDNLNKSAAVGFDYNEIGERLSRSWTGDPARKNVFQDVQEAASRFRAFCLEHNLLDFSLQMEVFLRHLWPHPTVRHWLQAQYHHLIYDNVEEDIPRAHDLIAEWLPKFETALLIYDEGGGYRAFLGADPQNGWALGEICKQHAQLDESFVISEPVAALHTAFDSILHENPEELISDWRPALDILTARYYPELLEQVALTVEALLQDGLPPEEIAIIAPFVSDALRFALQYRLETRSIISHSQRPSRPLHNEPATRVLLTLAQLAHPHWPQPQAEDVALAFMFALQTDLPRAHLLTQIVWHKNSLSPWETIRSETQERFGFALGERYERLRQWLLAWHNEETPLPLDFFLQKLFGEVLSQPGFGFHANLDAARIAGSLVESVGKFRRALMPALEEQADESAIGQEYLRLLTEGVIAAQYLPVWETPANSVLIAPVFSFLMQNRPVRVQIWLSPGAPGWSERLQQPLTHPVVLSRNWPPDRLWTDHDEVRYGQEQLSRLVSGLLLRCRERIVLAVPELGESGFEERTALLPLIQTLLQRSTTHE